MLLAAGSLTHGSWIGGLAAQTGLAAGGSCAAFALDDDSGLVVDATPTSRRRWLGSRMLVLILPLAIAVTGLLVLNKADGPAHWGRLLPLSAVVIAAGLATAAWLWRRGYHAPGEPASSAILLGFLLCVLTDPLHRWVTVVPLGPAPDPGRSVLLWLVLLAVCVTTIAICSRDPAGR